MADRAPRGKLVVRLEAVPNPDYTSPDEPLRTIRVPPRLEVVGSLAEAVRVCRAFQKGRGLGYGNWAGGEVYDDAGVQVAYVAYGGSVWESIGSRRPVEVRDFDMSRRTASRAVEAERWAYWELDELGDAFQIVQMEVESAEKLVKKESGLIRKFRSVLPRVSDIVLMIGNLRDRVSALREEIRVQKGFAGRGGKPQGEVDPEKVLSSARFAALAARIAGDFTVAKGLVAGLEFKDAATRRWADEEDLEILESVGKYSLAFSPGNGYETQSFGSLDELEAWAKKNRRRIESDLSNQTEKVGFWNI